MDSEDEEPTGFWATSQRAILDASLAAFDLSERTARRGWRSQKKRVRRWWGRLFMIVQIALAGGLSWWLATRLLGHEAPFLAVVAAIVCLGFSFGQRLHRAVEIAVGVTVGVLCGELFVHFFGTGVWQIIVVLMVAMSITTWLGARTLMVTQSGVQAAVVLTILPNVDAGISRWADALVGCAVALVFATVAPTSPASRPRRQAAKVLHGTSATIRAMVTALRGSDAEAAEAALENARRTERELSELTNAVNEGAAVVRHSPFLRHRRDEVLQIVDLTVPLDRFTRNLRVLARRATVAVAAGEPVPESYLALLEDLALVTDGCADELDQRRRPDAMTDRISDLATRSADARVTAGLSSTVILAQIRSMLVDLLELCGLGYTEARAAIPDSV